MPYLCEERRHYPRSYSIEYHSVLVRSDADAAVADPDASEAFCKIEAQIAAVPVPRPPSAGGTASGVVIDRVATPKGNDDVLIYSATFPAPTKIAKMRVKVTYLLLENIKQLRISSVVRIRG